MTDTLLGAVLSIALLTATPADIPQTAPVVRYEPLQAITIPNPAIDLCSCVKYARTLIPALPVIRTPNDLKPNTNPAKGVAVLLDYNLPHIAVVLEVSAEGILIGESNYRLCRKSERFLKWDDPNIRGYWKPLSTPNV